ncbi:MAG: alpha-hydroxy acid oxidase [Solirubrobacterales bacterium]
MSAAPVNLEEYEALARENLEASAYDYYRSGAGAGATLGRNRQAFAEARLWPRVLVDVSERDLGVEVLGRRMSSPVVVAPTAFHRLAHADGERETARGARAADVTFCLSTLSNTAMEDVAAVAGDRWFQLYVFRDRAVTTDLVRRAEQAGFGAILVTVDAPLLGRREADVRNRFSLPDGLRIACVSEGDVSAPVEGGSGLASYFTSMLDASLRWEDLEWLVGQTDLPVAVKGVHRADDARRAAEAGAAGVIVSNHGARQLDTVPATLDMLGPIADAVGDELDVLMDGGIRRGTDVVTALATGARAVLVGRPVLWALAAGGAEAVTRMLGLLQAEVDEAMALCGCPSVTAVDRSLLHP